VILTKCYGGIPEPADFVGRSDEEKLRMLSVNDGIMVNRIGLSRKHIFDAVDASVERLGTYIDVLQIHRLDRNTPREEIMKALNDVVESGKVRYLGASSVCTVFLVLLVKLPVGPNRYYSRCTLGNFKLSTTSPISMDGTSSSACKITIPCCTGKKSVICTHIAAMLGLASFRGPR
jgi:hypothetical protein